MTRPDVDPNANGNRTLIIVCAVLIAALMVVLLIASQHKEPPITAPDHSGFDCPYFQKGSQDWYDAGCG